MRFSRTRESCRGWVDPQQYVFPLRTEANFADNTPYSGKGTKLWRAPIQKHTEESSLELDLEQRAGCSILVIEPNSELSEELHSHLTTLKYGAVSCAHDMASAKKKLEQRNFTHLIITNEGLSFPIDDFLKELLHGDEDIIIIISSSIPNLEEVFDLLVVGARGYLVRPFTQESLEHAIACATVCKPIAEAFINVQDRNETLVNILLNNLDKACDAVRDSGDFATAQRELPHAMTVLSNSVSVAITFAEGGQGKYLEKLEDVMVERSNGPATRLGRLRKRLKNRRSKIPPITEG